MSGSSAEPVVVLYASISVLNLMRAATGSQCNEMKRGVTWVLLGSLKTSREILVCFTMKHKLIATDSLT